VKSLKIALLASLCFGFVSNAQANVLATVGNTKITLKEFNQKYNKVLESAIHPPTKAAYLEDLIRLEIGLQEAKKKKLQNDPIVRERYEQILYAALVEQAIGKQVEKIKITESDMKKYYAKTPELRTNHILIQIPPNATKAQKAEAKARAQKILKEVRSSKKSFAELVALYSDDQSTKRNGGDIGWQSRLTIVPQYYDAAFKLKTGQIVSSPVETKFGYHIIKLVDRNPYERANKRHLRQVIFDQKRGDIFNAFFGKLKKKYKISVNKKLLK
jgi:peptidyl-prolyl cis-trans isomerase C/peptidyl-prolyl cis-trans isomerase D